MMALRGVRSSWLMFARNWLLARLATSAASRALSSSRMSRRMPMAPMTRPSGSRRAEAFSVVAMVSPLALRGLRRALRVTPFSTTSRSAAVNSRVSSALMKRDSDCSTTSSRRKPSSWETASLACRILPSRSETNTGSGALAMMMSAPSARSDRPAGGVVGKGGGVWVLLLMVSSVPPATGPATLAPGASGAHGRRPGYRSYLVRYLDGQDGKVVLAGSLATPPLDPRHRGGEALWGGARRGLLQRVQQPPGPEVLADGVPGLDQAVGVQDQPVPRIEPRHLLPVVGGPNAHREAGGFQQGRPRAPRQVGGAGHPGRDETERLALEVEG